MTKRRINVRGIVYRDGKILAVRHKKSDGSPSDYWAVPGGGLDPMESIEDGVKREFMEELGVAVTTGRILLMQQFISHRESSDEEFEVMLQVEDHAAFDAIDLMATTHGADEIYDVAFIDPAKERIMPTVLSTMNYAAIISGDEPPVILNELY